jgi:hypothetical protein
MKLLILTVVIFVICSPLFGQTAAPEVDLNVKGIRSGTTQTRIIAKLGKPSSVKTIGRNECGPGFLKELRYPGLVVGLLSDAKHRNYTVISLGVTSSRWMISPGIRIGASYRAVRAKYGRSLGEIDPRDAVKGELKYVAKHAQAYVTFYFKGEKLVRIEMTETLC